MYNPHALVVRSLIVSTCKAFPRKSSDEELKANSRVPLKSTYNAPPSKCSPVLVTLAYPMLGAETEPSVRRICAVFSVSPTTTQTLPPGGCVFLFNMVGAKTEPFGRKIWVGG